MFFKTLSSVNYDKLFMLGKKHKNAMQHIECKGVAQSLRKDFLYDSNYLFLYSML